MFSKLSVVCTSVLITLAAATPNNTPPVATSPSDLCCESVVPATGPAASAAAVLFGVNLTGINNIGVSCSPLTLLGNNCDGTEVTCDAPEKEWAEPLAINCIPITA
ncbi:Hydrophobin 2 [Mycena sanguinolenta]|uniref:Hydrophobin n=1 Tax=Mycena sanguinolenta TaxID=230812 RepID=A0A8H6XXY2_9AGAR|nr:Hydrophobin 2 [Mycena sanguinolenta]